MGNGGLNGLTFREAVAADRPAIEMLAELTQQEHVNRLPDAFFPRQKAHQQWLNYLFETVVDERVVPFARLIVASLDDRVVGYVLLLFNFSSRGEHGRDLMCHITDITVAPDLRSRGIGTALMQRVQEVLQEEQATKVEGTVWRGNDASHKLFQNAAFVPQATVYATRLRAPMPATANGDERPAKAQGSSFWLVVLAIVVAALAWVEWGPH